METGNYSRTNGKQLSAMTIEKLERYCAISAEIDAIDEEIQTLYNPVSSPNGRENIGQRGNTPSNPTERSAFRIIMLKEKVEAKRESLYELLDEIETWLGTLTDTEISAIIRWHYLLRLDWKRTNIKVYGYPNYDYSRKKISRYFQKLSELSE